MKLDIYMNDISYIRSDIFLCQVCLFRNTSYVVKLLDIMVNIKQSTRTDMAIREILIYYQNSNDKNLNVQLMKLLDE